jgi:ribonucleoside-diphosphate reductase alpha chain
MPSYIDWSKLQEFEKEDTTVGSQTAACSAGTCEIVDLVQ